MDSNDVLETDAENFAAVLVGNFDSVTQPQMAFADLGASKIACAFLSFDAGGLDSHEFDAFGIKSDIITVHVEVEAWHPTTTL